jgi:acyl-CoA thioester hydrolase
LKPPALALDQIFALGPALLRIVVPDAWADSNDHMNMRWYVAVFDDAGDELHARIGLKPGFHTVDLEHHTNFLNEVMPGDRLAVYARLVARSAKRVHYLMFLVNETRGRLAAIFECMNAFLDPSVRRTAAFPPAILAKIDAWLERDSNLDWPPPVSGAMNVK